MLLQFDGVFYRYPRFQNRVLNNINLSFSPGEMVLLAGASGSGKSSFCRACVGLVPHFYGGELSGRIFVSGLNTRQAPVYRLFTKAGLVFQNPDAQLFNQTVEAELAYGLESLGLASEEIERRIAWAAALTGLEALMERPPYSLSGGEKQRLALGVVLALRPPLLILDEPFANLDPEGAADLRRILNEVRSEGTAVIVVEHRIHELAADADRLIILSQGRVVADGPPRQVLSDDVSPYGLNLPPLVRLFREKGWKEVPLTVEEALKFIRSKDPPVLEEMVRQYKGFGKDSKNIAQGAAAVVEINALWFAYEAQTVLKGIDLTLYSGECLALIGRNGAGKTTLVRHFNGLLRGQRGRVRIFGKDASKIPVSELARKVGFAWQNPNDQLFRSSIREEILAGPKALGAYNSEWCEGLFERFHLKPLLDRTPFLLSEGEKKRVSFASALAAQPGLIVLDEPTAGQDESFRRELGRLIKELRQEGKTVVLVTHDLEFAALQANRWLVMAQGKIIADGTPETVMTDSETLKNAGLRPIQPFRLNQALRTQ
jgi:energy-coupling factor transport system ATP-binding protein